MSKKKRKKKKTQNKNQNKELQKKAKNKAAQNTSKQEEQLNPAEEKLQEEQPDPAEEKLQEELEQILKNISSESPETDPEAGQETIRDQSTVTARKALAEEDTKTNVAWKRGDSGKRTGEQRIKLIRQVLIVLLILSSVIFLFVNKDNLRNREKINLFDKTLLTQKVKYPIKGNHTMRQSFVAESGAIGNIFIRIRNPKASSATGKVRVSLEDSNGKRISSTSLDASQININKKTQFVLGQSSEDANQNRIVSTSERSYKNASTPVVKGQVYTIVLESIDVDGDGPISLVLLNDPLIRAKRGLFAAETDGEIEQDKVFDMEYQKLSYETGTLVFIGIVLLLTIFFVLLPFEELDKKYPKYKPARTAALVIFASAPLVTYYIIEKYLEVNKGSFVIELFSLLGILNLLIIGLIWWAIFTVSNNTRLTALLTALTGSIFGLVNYALLQFRDTPLIATDFAQTGTAMQVAGTYTLTYSKVFLTAVFVTCMFCAAALAPPPNKGLEFRKRLVPLVILVIWTMTVRYVVFTSDILPSREIRVSGFKPKDSYTENGCALSFAVTVKNSIVSKPEGYSPDEITELARKYPSDKAVKAEEVSGKTPNIIFIMNESFADLSVLGEIRSNKDWMPFYRSIKDNAIKGTMDSSIYGGSTANSEFESLTGFSVRFLPYMSVPYRSVIRSEIPSLAYYLSDLGYGGGIAFHPGMINSYNRNVVYPLLGFSKHMSIDDVKEPRNIRDYLSDEHDYDIVEEEYEKYRKSEKDAPFFLFNVTIQNHGAYSIKQGVVNKGITIDESDMGDETELQFVNLIKYSDEALEDLIDYFSNVDEETVIVFFGDHQPRSDEIFLENMKNSHKGISDLEWADLTHQVPFMIWANYDIEEKQDFELSANYISPYMKSVLGMPLTGFDKYLLDLRSELPVVNAIDYKDNDGNIYDSDEETQYTEKIDEYSRVQYNGMMDGKNRVNEFFELSK